MKSRVNLGKLAELVRYQSNGRAYCARSLTMAALWVLAQTPTSQAFAVLEGRGFRLIPGGMPRRLGGVTVRRGQGWWAREVLKVWPPDGWEESPKLWRVRSMLRALGRGLTREYLASDVAALIEEFEVGDHGEPANGFKGRRA